LTIFASDEENLVNKEKILEVALQYPEKVLGKYGAYTGLNQVQLWMLSITVLNGLLSLPNLWNPIN